MKRRLAIVLGVLLVAAAAAAPPRVVRAQQGGAGGGSAVPGAFADDLAVMAREAFRVKDAGRLFTLRQAAAAQGHPLASWIEYWELANRLADAQPGDFDAFVERWRGTYVEDRLRNDWLLELGRRRDWTNLRAEFPRFRMNDDREVTCYAQLAAHLAGQGDLRAARQAWLAQRDSDDGCQLLGATMFEQRLFGADDLWAALRVAAELNRPRLARERAALFDAALATQVEALFKDPGRFLRERRGRGELQPGLGVLAVWRLAASEPDLAAGQVEQFEAARWPPMELARAWGGVARHAALKQNAKAAEFARRAYAAWDRVDPRPASEAPFSEETLAWLARAALRSNERTRWTLVLRAVDDMSATEQRDPAWTYWRARALRANAPNGPDGEGARALARMTLESIAGPLGFYPQLAQEELGRRITLPAPPVPLVESEREPVRQHAGLRRALRLIALGLRAEGVREWNYSLRGMNDRELLAAAALACEREIWDRCINTSERTRDVADIAQRYPLPFREAVLARGAESGVDPAYIYGLIRQESRFILDARSSAGAAGLMQLMPATARWTARRVGLQDWRAEQVIERDINLLLGTTYLKLVLDEFAGAQAMGAAAYNAGPARPRRWREGTPVEAAAWIEGIPFNETRDYVRKVLSNAVVYALRLQQLPPAAEGAGGGNGGGNGSGNGSGNAGGPPAASPGPASLRARLGGPIGPRDPSAPAEMRDLP